MAAKRKRKTRRTLKSMNPDAAGIDIGSRFHVAAVPPDRDDNPVRSFDSFTGDLHRLADWLESCDIKTVVMESTSVYWMPLYSILDSRGFDVLLTNARDVKHVPGRKSDVNDAQWLQRLHEFGLVRGSFHPAEGFDTLRAYLRQRERLVEYAASHTQHMQKALMLMNLQLHHVVADITGSTGLRIIRAIVDGERDPHVLAQMRDRRCKNTVQTISAALEGSYSDDQVLALEQSLSLFDTYQLKIAQCDEHIEAVLIKLRQADSQTQPLKKLRRNKKQSNEPKFDVRAAVHAVCGVDLTEVHGVGPYLALRILGECGTDLSKWPTAKHFTSWLGLAPGTKISGGKILSSKTRRTDNRVASLLRLAAMTVGKTDSALGAFYRRLSSRVGKAKAITATARKIAVLIYNLLRYGKAYLDPGAQYYEEQHRARVVRNLKRRAQSLGFTIEPAVIEGVS